VSRICIQRGHCFLTRGATGTAHEQELVSAIGQHLVTLLMAQGHRTWLIGAHEPVPAADVFVALHTDGSNDLNRRGGSVGYPDARGGELAQRWKRAHARYGFPGGFHGDNYTRALAGYYGFGDARRSNPACVCFLAEHGTTTHAQDLAWIRANVVACAAAHAEAIAEHTGVRPVDPGGGEMTDPIGAMRDPDTAEGVWVATKDGGIRAYAGANFHGSYPGLPPEARQGVRTFARFERSSTLGKKYRLVSSAGESYEFPA
jgi:hypothetical protein